MLTGNGKEEIEYGSIFVVDICRPSRIGGELECVFLAVRFIQWLSRCCCADFQARSRQEQTLRGRGWTDFHRYGLAPLKSEVGWVCLYGSLQLRLQIFEHAKVILRTYEAFSSMGISIQHRPLYTDIHNACCLALLAEGRVVRNFLNPYVHKPIMI